MKTNKLQQLKRTHMRIAMKYVGALEEVAGFFLNFILSCLWPHANLSLSSVCLCA